MTHVSAYHSVIYQHIIKVQEQKQKNEQIEFTTEFTHQKHTLQWNIE